MHGNLADPYIEMLGNEMREQIDREIIENILWEAKLEEHPDWHLVQLVWEKGKDTAYFWNEACAWAIEQFGLPGDNYVTHPTETHMDFLFKHQEHAVLMTLKWI
jgi:hypothetical protein